MMTNKVVIALEWAYFFVYKIDIKMMKVSHPKYYILNSMAGIWAKYNKVACVHHSLQFQKKKSDYIFTTVFK